MNLDEDKRVAVITGAGGTLCSEMAKTLAKRGIQVALLGRNLDKLKNVEIEIRETGGEAISLSVDVTDMQQVDKACQRIIEKMGVPEILINGAGGNQKEATTTFDHFNELELHGSEDVRGFFNMDLNSFFHVLEANTMGTVIPSRVFGKEMAGKMKGNIINIASMNSFKPLSKVCAYSMAKAGIVNFTKWLSVYLAPAGIRVNAIAPGFFLNDRNKDILLKDDDGYTERGENIIRRTPLRRFGEPYELVGCLNWLIDDIASGFVTGITIPIDGGFLASSGI